MFLNSERFNQWIFPFFCECTFFKFCPIYVKAPIVLFHYHYYYCYYLLITTFWIPMCMWQRRHMNSVTFWIKVRTTFTFNRMYTHSPETLSVSVACTQVNEKWPGYFSIENWTCLDPIMCCVFLSATRLFSLSFLL